MAFLGQEEQLREFQDRFKYLYAILLISLGILVARLIYLQIFNGENLRRMSEQNRIKRVVISAPRGMIYDRNRTLLIDNQPAFDLEVHTQYLPRKKRKEIIGKVSDILNIPEKNIYRKIKRARHQQERFRPVKIKTDLTRDEVAKIETWRLDMPMVEVGTEIQRTNLFGDVASHLLGYVGKVNSAELPILRRQGKNYKLRDKIGKVGIEKQLEDQLRGQDGQEIIEVDASMRRIRDEKKGRVFGDHTGQPAIPGRNLILTIDQDLQLAARDAFGEKVGALVAINPKNGEILAMISRPSFDPTGFSRGIPAKIWNGLLANENRPLVDKTVQDHYSPGSVFKIITAIAGLEEKVITENTSFNCPGAIRVGNRIYHCHKRGGHGNVSVVSAIAQSCDVFFYRVAQKLKSVDIIAKWAKQFGLGEKTGIDLPREVPGLIPTEEWKLKTLKKPWTKGESLSVAIGQSFVLTTILQVANLYASMANNGTLFKPYFIRTIESFDGEILEEFEPQEIGTAEMSAKSLDLVKKGLWSVINSPRGTGFRLRLPGMDFAGKSGTSQVVRLSKEKIYSKCSEMKYKFRHHGLFAGFAPAKNPVIAVAAIAEHSCSGSAGAGPIVKAVIQTYLEKYYPDLYPKNQPSPVAQVSSNGAEE